MMFTLQVAAVRSAPPDLTLIAYGHIVMTMKNQDENIAAGKFKAECLALMDIVAEAGAEYTITKHGKPVAKLVPVGKSAKSKVFGCMQGTARATGDIISPLDAGWEAHEGP